MHPALLDAIAQVFAVAGPGTTLEDAKGLYLPVGLGRLRARRGWCLWRHSRDGPQRFNRAAGAASDWVPLRASMALGAAWLSGISTTPKPRARPVIILTVSTVPEEATVVDQLR